MADGDEVYQRPEGFDLDGSFSQDDIDIDTIVEKMGWSSWREVIADVESVDGFDLRPGVYFSAADAIREAWDRGILDFTLLFWDGESWQIIVSYPEMEE